MNIKSGLTFDDVLLVPKYSQVTSRKNVNLSVNLGKGVLLDNPIISANMKTVTGKNMANAIAELGGLAIIHRFCSIDEQIAAFNPVYNNNIGFSIGVQEADKDALKKFVDIGAKIICVDVAHGYHKLCLDMIRYIREFYSSLLIIAGNVANGDGAFALANAGAHVVKVGVGPGSLCSTRIETGNGVPQLTALDDVKNKFKAMNWDIKIIADGGIKNAGDITKALCFADAVMLGNLLAGTDEAPGEVVTIQNQTYKTYAGSSTHKTNHVEGVVGLVPCKGPVSKVVEKLLEGLKSGMSYQGVENLTDLKSSHEFVQISQAGLSESHPHSILVQ